MKCVYLNFLFILVDRRLVLFITYDENSGLIWENEFDDLVRLVDVTTRFQLLFISLFSTYRHWAPIANGQPNNTRVSLNKRKRFPPDDDCSCSSIVQICSRQLKLNLNSLVRDFHSLIHWRNEIRSDRKKKKRKNLCVCEYKRLMIRQNDHHAWKVGRTRGN